MLRKAKLIATILMFSLSCHAEVNSNSTSNKSTDSYIDFIDLEATPTSKIVHFKWKVGAESNGDFFLIEKSFNDEKWKAIARVESIKNHTNEHTYLTSEINLAEGAHETFRLKRIDLYGNTTVLDEIYVSQPILSNLFLIPVLGKANKQMIISNNSMICSNGTLSVVNHQNEVVYERNIHLDQGYNRFILITKDYRKEEFTVRIKNEFGNYVSRPFILSKGTSRRSKF